jgi:MFS family permease
MQVSMIIMITVVVVALPVIARDLGVDPSLGVWVTFIPMLVSAALCTPFGRIADIYGRKSLFFAGCTCHIAAQLVSANAPSFEVLLFARGLTGLGDALTKVTGSAIALSMFRAEVH